MYDANIDRNSVAPNEMTLSDAGQKFIYWMRMFSFRTTLPSSI